jgi:hypothetical protein
MRRALLVATTLFTVIAAAGLVVSLRVRQPENPRSLNSPPSATAESRADAGVHDSATAEVVGSAALDASLKLNEQTLAEVVPAELVPARAAPVKVRPGKLKIIVQPWAYVTVVGHYKRIEASPDLTLSLPPGKHQVLLMNDAIARKPVVRRVVIHSGRETALNETLMPFRPVP